MRKRESSKGGRDRKVVGWVGGGEEQDEVRTGIVPL